MGISIADENEFTFLIADLIETLSGTGEFILKIWVNNNEIPYKYTHEDNFYFMQEGFRVSSDGVIDWFFYDMISSVRLYYDKIERLAIGFSRE